MRTTAFTSTEAEGTPISEVIPWLGLGQYYSTREYGSNNTAALNVAGESPGQFMWRGQYKGFSRTVQLILGLSQCYSAEPEWVL